MCRSIGTGEPAAHLASHPLGFRGGMLGPLTGHPRPMSADSTSVPQDATTVRLPFEATSASEARALVSDHLRATASQRAIEDAQLVVTELVSNGVRHGRPTDQEAIEVSWWSPTRDVLRISVCDGGRVDELTVRQPDPQTPGGRGLLIVDHLSLSWSYETDSSPHRGTRVTADIPLE